MFGVTPLESSVEDMLSKAGLLAMRWVVVAEVIEPEGGRALVCVNSADLSSWDRNSILSEAMEEDGWDDDGGSP